MPPKELGYDELSAVMILATGNSIHDIFRLSHVCRTWRNVALSTPHLWAWFAVRTMADALKLPVVIRRASSRRSVPMDVTLDFTGSKVLHVGSDKQEVVPLIDPEDSLGICQDLSPHLPFVTRLFIRLGVPESDLNAAQHLSCLFTFATPVLEKLSVFGAFLERPIAGRQPIVPLEFAPRLRSLSLTGAIPQDWKTAISPTLEELYLKISVAEAGFLVYILRTCLRLTRFTFLPVCDTDFTFANQPLTTRLKCLRELHIGGHVENVWRIIAPVICHAVLDSITVSIASDAPPGTVDFVGRFIFPDAWSLVSCALRGQNFHHIRGQQDILLVDGAGKEHRVLITQPRSCFGDLWGFLVLKTNALDSINTFSFAYWKDVCNVFHTHPLRHPRLQLRVSPPRYIHDDPIDSRLRMLNCPTVRGVTFVLDESRRPLELKMVLAVVDHIVHQHTTVCVGDAFAEHPNRSWVSAWLAMLQRELSQRNGWLLCSHCAAHII